MFGLSTAPLLFCYNIKKGTERSVSSMAEAGQAKNPVLVYCSGCGSPTDFDVVHQNYHCTYCGARMAITEPLQAKRSWREARQQEFRRQLETLRKEVYTCPKCGANVVVAGGEALSKCAFCGTSLVRREFLASDVFPELVIPFNVTRAEALHFLQDWCGANQDKPEAKILNGSLQQLQGYYLPYQLVKGPVSCQVSRDNTDRHYHCGGYLDGVAINTSQQLDNLLLDAVEPFDWEGTREFDFAYLTGQRVKLQDISVAELEHRVADEVAADYTPVVEKALETTGIHLNVRTENMLVLPILLPVYLVQAGKVKAAINGQTGRVAVAALAVKKDKAYLREPLLTTLGLAVLTAAGLWYISDSLAGIDWSLVAAATVLFGLIAFCVFTQGRSAKNLRAVFTGPAQRLRRVNGNCVVEAFTEKTRAVPVFFEKIQGQLQAVAVSFYSPGRVAQWILAAVAAFFLPLLLGFVSNGFSTRNLLWYGAAPWMCLVGILVPVLYMRLGRVVVYDYPIFKRLREDGSLEELPAGAYSDFSLRQILQTAFLPGLRFLTIGLLVFLLLSAVIVAYGK